MELARYKACICEGATENAIMDVLLDNEDMYKEYKKSGKKPSEFCKVDLKMPNVKSYDFVKKYFRNSKELVAAIVKYYRVSKIKKGEYTLLDLLKS